MLEGFHRPTTPREAAQMKERLGSVAFYLGGGTELNSREQWPPPRHLIDLAGLGAGAMEFREEAWFLGSGCTLQAVLESAGAPGFLRVGCGQQVNRNLRNASTLGGRIAGRRVDSGVVPALVAADALLEVVFPDGHREMGIQQYRESDRRGLILKIRVPKDASRRIALRKVARSCNDLPTVVAAVGLTREGDRVGGVVAAVLGFGLGLTRLGELESCLEGRRLASDEEILRLAVSGVEPASDFRGSSDYKRFLVGELVRQCLHAAFEGKGRVAA